MSRTTKTRREIELMIMERVNANPQHDGITGIAINPGGRDGSPANWSAGAYHHKPGAHTEMLEYNIETVVTMIEGEFDISD